MASMKYSKTPGEGWSGIEGMADYTSMIDSIREIEYPMLKGSRWSSVSVADEAHSCLRHNLS